MVTLTLLDTKQSPVEQWNFETETQIRIGRAPDNHVVLHDSLVSRYHLELHRTHSGSPEAWTMVNQGKNGTFLNGVLVSQGGVGDGATLQLAQGGPVLRVEVPQAVPSPVPVSASGCSHEGNAPGNLFCIHCGEPIRIEQRVRQYAVLRTLGKGGMGTTYLAWDATLGQSSRPEAVKTPLLVLKEMNADLAQIAKARELFEREARTLKNLHHPGIPQFFDFFVEDGKKYLAMELVHGEDLEKRVYEKGVCRVAQAIAWAIQTCEVLEYLHSQTPPIVHRDIKPANLLVRHSDQQIVVIDFGAVKEIGTPFGTRIGAEGYSAPEQDLGRPVTQSDLYAIGPTLVFLLTGERPNKYVQKVGFAHRLALEHVASIPAHLRFVIEKVTEHRVRDRYQSAPELAKALTACLSALSN